MASSSVPSNSSIKLHFRGPARYQISPYPNYILKYIAANPSSPTLHTKLTKSCKYFFIKNPVFTMLKDSSNEMWESFINEKREKVMVKSQIWIASFLSFSSSSQNQSSLSTLIPKLYKCDAIQLNISSQTLSLKEFRIFSKKLSLTVEKVYLHNFTVLNEDGSIVPVEKIVEAFSMVKKFRNLFHTNPSFITSNTMKELIKLPNFLKLDCFFLQGTSDALDLKTFYYYMKESFTVELTNKKTKFQLQFIENSISEAYKNILEKIIDEIIAAEEHDYKPPTIYWPGLDHEKIKKLARISSNF